MLRRVTTTVVLGVVALIGEAPLAPAATQIGETFGGDKASCGSGPVTWLQTGSPGNQYAAPSAGVITSWSYWPDEESAPEFKFKVARPAGNDSYIILDESPVKSPLPDQLNTYTDIRVPVQPGDVIGFSHGFDDPACGRTVTGYTMRFTTADVPPGTTPVLFGGVAASDSQAPLSASLEPDCDGDGFGDETQDASVDPAGCNPPEPDPQTGDTSPPNAAITKAPKDKTRKKQATFEFNGTDTRAVAGFQCSLDGAPFATCTSPHTVKVRKGKHTFQVRAIDQAGNVGTPASDDWKRKKKRK